MRRAFAVFATMLAVGVMSQMPSVRAATSAEEKTVTGVLIDNHCAAGMIKKEDAEAAAAKHPGSCAKMEACEKSGYAVISGKTLLKFDDNGNKLAKEFLAKTEKKDDLHIVVKGTETDGKLAVTSLEAAPAK